MQTAWFVIVVLMLSIYVVLDGFDFGAGIVSSLVAKTDAEHRTVLSAIGPVWNGNEVWLIAGGGVLFLAFPRVYAAGFSGFYLALIVVLWLLVLRGLAIELRSHLKHPLWRALWDKVFAVASLVLALVLGVALGNVVRGVPLQAEGYFFIPWWTDFALGPAPGILDWYTLLMGLLGVAVLSVHGANYLAMKTEGDIHRRATRIAARGLWVVLALTVATLAAIPTVQPSFVRSYGDRPAGYVLLAAAGLGLLGTFYCRWRRRDVGAFFASSLFILAAIGSTAWGLYPRLLIATTDPAYSLTAANSAAALSGLRVGLAWFVVGISLVMVYMVYVYRSFWGKVPAAPSEEGY